MALLRLYREDSQKPAADLEVTVLYMYLEGIDPVFSACWHEVITLIGHLRGFEARIFLEGICM